MSPSPSLTLKDLILVRFLASGPNGLTTSEIGKSLQDFAANMLSASDWKRALSETLSSLDNDGKIETIRKSRYVSTDSGTRSALDVLGLAKISGGVQWGSLKNTHLLARALGLPALTNDTDRKRFATVEGLRGAILTADYQLPTGPYPTLTEARNALLWQRLADADLPAYVRERLPNLVGKAFTQGAVMAFLLNHLLASSRELDWDSALNQLVAKAVDAKRTDPNELRLAVLRKSLADIPIATTPTTFDLAGFAQEVKRTARTSGSGRFGENKVFISHVWKQLGTNGHDFGLSEVQFKERLGEANNKGLLKLSRADLAQALDQEDVTASETKYLTATFHFVRLD